MASHEWRRLVRQKAGLGINLQVTDVECNCNLEIVTDGESTYKPRNLRMAMKLYFEKFGKKKLKTGSWHRPKTAKKHNDHLQGLSTTKP